MDCVGCVYDERCLIQNSSLNAECPCRICIVKVICSGMCKDFNDHYAKVILDSLNESKEGITK